MNRRCFLQGTAGALAASKARALAAGDLPHTTGKGDVKTPVFHRHDFGVSLGGRLHEPSGDEDGNLWTSPLDGSLWRYHVPSGRLEILDLKAATRREWKGLHLWPIAYGSEVYLCSPSLPELWVLERDSGQVKRYPFPHANPQVYGGFALLRWRQVWLYDTSAPGVLKWDPATHTGVLFRCPYIPSGTLYMTFADEKRREIWGSTYTGNDLVRFDTAKDEWTGHWKSPLEKATPTPTNAVFGNRLYVSDHLNGRLMPFDCGTGEWGEPIPVPGYREWFGYLSGGWVFRGLIYFCHSTWTGGDSSLDGKPHHFIGAWTVFDPKTRRFSRLDIPTREGESLMSDYALTVRGELCILAVDMTPPYTAVVLRGG